MKHNGSQTNQQTRTLDKPCPPSPAETIAQMLEVFVVGVETGLLPKRNARSLVR